MMASPIIDSLPSTKSLPECSKLFSINGFSINEIIEKIANSKVKDYKSLTNKTLFKFMDLIDM